MVGLVAKLPWVLFTNIYGLSGPQAGEMAQWLKALPETALPEVLSSVPSNHMVAHNHLSWDPGPSSGVSEVSYSALIYKINK